MSVKKSDVVTKALQRHRNPTPPRQGASLFVECQPVSETKAHTHTEAPPASHGVTDNTDAVGRSRTCCATAAAPL